MTSSSAEADAAAGRTTTAVTKISKRQRRKELATSTKHVTPQQPNLTNPEARAQAYLRVAGLGNTTNTTAITNDSTKFGRLLGSTEPRKRHAVVRQLNTYLKERCSMTSVGLSELDLLKVWKGLWYTLYMADKAVVQEELSKQLAQLLWAVAGTEEEDEYAAQAYLDATSASDGDDEDDIDEDEDDIDAEEQDVDEDDIDEEQEDIDEDDIDEERDHDIEKDSDDEEFTMQEVENTLTDEEEDDTTVPHCRGAHLASLFLKTFFSTISREWGTMDKYRVDKFYTLIRCMMHQVYKYMALRHWNLGIVQLFNDTIFDQILSQTPNGLRFHLIDITLEELAKVNKKYAPMPLTEATLCSVLEPYFAMVQGMDDKAVQQRIVDNIIMRFLVQYSLVGDTAEEEDNYVFDNVHVGTIADFIFTIGSDVTTKDEYRKKLYDAHKQYQRRIKNTGRDLVIDHELDHDCGHDHEHDEDCDHLHEHESDDEAPQLLLLDDNDEDETPQTPEPTPEPKKTKKKRKRDKEPPIEMEEDVHVDLETKPPKKKKKRTKKAKRDSVNIIESDVKQKAKVDVAVEEKKITSKGTTIVDEVKHKKDEPIKELKPNHKKKTKKDKRASTETKTEEEEEIIISVAEQKKAKKASLKAPAVVEPQTVKQEKKKQREEDERRRVSFGRVNHSKSHKASMRDLKNASPKPLPITPDRSILRVKTPPTNSAKRSGSANQQKRKKASEYF